MTSIMQQAQELIASRTPNEHLQVLSESLPDSLIQAYRTMTGIDGASVNTQRELEQIQAAILDGLRQPSLSSLINGFESGELQSIVASAASSLHSDLNKFSDIGKTRAAAKIDYLREREELTLTQDARTALTFIDFEVHAGSPIERTIDTDDTLGRLIDAKARENFTIEGIRAAKQIG